MDKLFYITQRLQTLCDGIKGRIADKVLFFLVK